MRLALRIGILAYLNTRNRTPNPAITNSGWVCNQTTKNPTSQSQWGAPQEATGSCGFVVLAVPNPQHVELLALLDITRGKQVNPATKNPLLSIQQQEARLSLSKNRAVNLGRNEWQFQ